MSLQRTERVMIHTKSLLVVALIAGTCVMPGCVLTSSNETHVRGVRVEPVHLQNLEKDVTTEGELLERLGTPTRTMPADEGGTIYVWEYEKCHESHGALIFVFGGHTEETEQCSASVLVRDGVVRSWWAG